MPQWWPPFKARRPEPAPPVRSAPQDVQALLQRLDWTVLRRLDGVLQGEHRSLFRGSGLDLADLREYQTHDDVRHIDWNVTARLQVPHVRQYQEDREVSAWFLLDMTGSMDFGSGERSKRERMLSFVAVMGLWLQRSGNRVGALILTGEPAGPLRHVPARMGRRHLLHLMHTVAQVPPVQGAHSTALAPWLQQAQSILRRRSQLFVLSDFLSPPGWEQALAGLARRHDGIAVRLTDPLERDWPAQGLLWLQDAETGEQMLLDASDPGLRERYAAKALEREAAFGQALALAGMDGLDLGTDDDLALVLRQFVAMRKRRALHA